MAGIGPVSAGTAGRYGAGARLPSPHFHHDRRENHVHRQPAKVGDLSPLSGRTVGCFTCDAADAPGQPAPGGQPGLVPASDTNDGQPRGNGSP